MEAGVEKLLITLMLQLFVTLHVVWNDHLLVSAVTDLWEIIIDHARLLSLEAFLGFFFLFYEALVAFDFIFYLLVLVPDLLNFDHFPV